MTIPRKILYILPSWFTFYHAVRGQLAYLKSEGFCIDVACEDDARAAVAAAREGVDYHKINVNTTSFLNVINLRALIKLIRLMRKNRYSIVYSGTKVAGFISAVAAKLTGTYWVIYGVRGMMSQNLTHVKKRLFPIIEKFICMASDRVVFVSKSNMDYFIAENICPPKKTVLLGSGSLNGVNINRFERTPAVLNNSIELQAKLGIPAEDFIFGYLGRLVKEKGIRELEQCWSIFRQEFSNVHLIIIGPPEVDESIADSVLALENDSRVHFLGFQKDPVMGYALMDCLLFPTYGEGLPTVILEAAAMEVPAIASKVIGCIDAVAHERTGLLVDSKDPSKLYVAMKRALENRNEVTQWGKNARERCIALFNQEMVWKNYENFYNSLLSGLNVQAIG